jgi:hypothetical protein
VLGAPSHSGASLLNAIRAAAPSTGLFRITAAALHGWQPSGDAVMKITGIGPCSAMMAATASHWPQCSVFVDRDIGSGSSRASSHWFLRGGRDHPCRRGCKASRRALRRRFAHGSACCCSQLCRERPVTTETATFWSCWPWNRLDEPGPLPVILDPKRLGKQPLDGPSRTLPERPLVPEEETGWSPNWLFSKHEDHHLLAKRHVSGHRRARNSLEAFLAT